MENVCFRRVQVFGGIVAQHTPAKTNHPTAFIANGEHHPLAETIVTASLIVSDQHARINQ